MKNNLKEIFVTEINKVFDEVATGNTLPKDIVSDIYAFALEMFTEDVLGVEGNEDVKDEAFLEVINNMIKERIQLAFKSAEEQHKFGQIIPKALVEKGYEEIYKDDTGRIFANLKKGQILKYDLGDSIEKFFYGQELKRLVTNFTTGQPLTKGLPTQVHSKGLQSIVEKLGYTPYFSSNSPITKEVSQESIAAYSINETWGDSGESSVMTIVNISRISGKQGENTPKIINSFSFTHDEAMAIKKYYATAIAEIEKEKLN